MSDSLEVPSEVPVMTLPDAVLFPQAIMPLYIFEPRYRQMVADVLSEDCLFAVAGLNEKLADEGGLFEPCYDTATVGIVRACHKNTDGTSNLVMQGLARVKVERIVKEDPYRVVAIAPLETVGGSESDELRKLRRRLTDMVESKVRMGAEVPSQVLKFLADIEDLEIFIDLAAYSLCSDSSVKQRLLETLNTEERYRLLIEHTRSDIEALDLDNLLRGNLDDDSISLN